MRGLKILGYCLGGLVAVVALLLIGVSVFVNPNDFKGRIAAQVKASTGRELSLPGDIRLSVFPWIALELGPLSLGNPQGFGSDPFLSVQHAALRVRLLPLLRKELEIGRIEVDGLDLALKKNAAGKGNWQDFGGSTPPADGAAPPATAQSRSAASLQGLGGIRITNSRISYDALTIANLNLELGNVSAGATVPLKASMDLSTGPAGSNLSMTATLDVMIDPAAQRLALTSVALGGDLKQAQGHALPWKFQAPSISVDLDAQTLAAPAFTAQAGAAALSGTLAGEKIVAAPALSGTLKLAPVAPRDLFGQAGIGAPKTRDPKALSSLAFAGEFSYGHNALRLHRLELHLDETTLRGSVAITDLDSKAMDVDLALDHIDLDRYRAPEAAAAQPASAPAELPTSPLKALALHGEFNVATAKVAGLTLSGLHAGIDAHGGVVHASQLRASLYGGTYAGDIVYDVSDAVPRITMDHQVANLDIAPLLKDSVHSTRLSGHGRVGAKLAASGRTSEAMLRSLHGRVDANLADGAVNGIDLWYEIGRAQALLRQTPMPTGSEDGRTKFDTFAMSADIVDGVATTRDLNIASPYLRVTGGGTANLASRAIDYHVVATILKTPPSSQGADLAQLTLAGIPVGISGTMDSPKVRPDIAGIVQSTLKRKLQQTIQDKLKGIFGN